MDYIAGIDIGGSKIAATLANQNGLQHTLTEPVCLIGEANALPQQALRLIDALCQHINISRHQITAVGVSTCSPFVQNGAYREIAAPNLCGGLSAESTLPNRWQSIALEEFLTPHFSKVKIENDCVAILAAERLLGSARGVANCVYATWSTGIGFGLCVDGHILRGKNGNAGHASHSYIDINSTLQCGCGNKGDVEASIGGHALARRYGAPAEQLFADAVNPHAARHAQATPIAHEAIGQFAILLYNLCVTLDTELFVLGGSVFTHNAELILPQLKKILRSKLPALTQGTRIVPAQFGTQAGDYGALALVLPPEWLTQWLKISK